MVLKLYWTMGSGVIQIRVQPCFQSSVPFRNAEMSFLSDNRVERRIRCGDTHGGGSSGARLSGPSALLAASVLVFASACKRPAPKASFDPEPGAASASQQGAAVQTKQLEKTEKSKAIETSEEVEKIAGIPIFFRSTPSQQEESLPEGAEIGELQGRLAGALKIVHGCLEVKGTAILWERQEKSKLDTIVKHLLAKDFVDVDLGGGSLNAFMSDKSLREEFPEVFLACPNTKSIWVSHSLQWTHRKKQ